MVSEQNLQMVSHVARKKSIGGILSNVAELGAGRMEETIGKASLRDAAIGAGIAVDKMLALIGQTPALQLANIGTADPGAGRAAQSVTRQAGCDRRPAPGTVTARGCPLTRVHAALFYLSSIE